MGVSSIDEWGNVGEMTSVEDSQGVESMSCDVVTDWLPALVDVIILGVLSVMTSSLVVVVGTTGLVDTPLVTLSVLCTGVSLVVLSPSCGGSVTDVLTLVEDVTVVLSGFVEVDVVDGVVAMVSLVLIGVVLVMTPEVTSSLLVLSVTMVTCVTIPVPVADDMALVSEVNISVVAVLVPILEVVTIVTVSVTSLTSDVGCVSRTLSVVTPASVSVTFDPDVDVIVMFGTGGV